MAKRPVSPDITETAKELRIKFFTQTPPYVSL